MRPAQRLQQQDCQVRSPGWHLLAVGPMHAMLFAHGPLDGTVSARCRTGPTLSHRYKQTTAVGTLSDPLTRLQCMRSGRVEVPQVEFPRLRDHACDTTEAELPASMWKAHSLATVREESPSKSARVRIAS